MKSLNFINMKPAGNDVVKPVTVGTSVEGLLRTGKYGLSIYQLKILLQPPQFWKLTCPQAHTT